MLQSQQLRLWAGEAELIIGAQSPLSDLLISSQVLYGLWWQVTCCYGLARELLQLVTLTDDHSVGASPAGCRPAIRPLSSPYPHRLLQWFCAVADWISCALLKNATAVHNFISGGSQLHVRTVWLATYGGMNLASCLFGRNDELLFIMLWNSCYFLVSWRAKIQDSVSGWADLLNAVMYHIWADVKVNSDRKRSYYTRAMLSKATEENTKFVSIWWIDQIMTLCFCPQSSGNRAKTFKRLPASEECRLVSRISGLQQREL